MQAAEAAVVAEEARAEADAAAHVAKLAAAEARHKRITDVGLGFRVEG